jgi:rifampicin phosphotransferase
MSSFIFSFDDNRTPLLAELGGKGYSLVRMRKSGLNVPPGFILPVQFFTPWVDQLKQTEQWNDFLHASSGQMAKNAENLQSISKDLNFTKGQKQELQNALAHFEKFKYFAVRSSSPEEDLEGASFAGGYETILGVSRNSINDAVLRAFCSCLHPRVFIYKQEQGFAIDNFNIAVVVQSQVDSEVAGVGFSINPINNDYDEAVFNSNWGLGETVVSGLASPDQITVNKINREILEYQIGKKESSIWLAPEAGTEERQDSRHKEKTLSEDQVIQLTDQLCKIESLYEKPMDIEWAYSNENLYLLQARPITTHLPLPPAMVTRPEEKRRLYLDISLVVQGLTEPISVLGHEFLRGLIKTFFNEVFGTEQLVDAKEGMVSIEGGRIYLNLSNAAHLFGTFQNFADKFQVMDTLTGEILREIDTSTYKNITRPAPLKKIGPQAALRNPDIPLLILQGILFPEKLAKRYHEKANNYLQTLQRLDKENLSERKFAKQIQLEAVEMLVHMAVPTFVFSQKAIRDLKGIFEEDIKTDDSLLKTLERIDQSLPHNLTVGMGLSLFKMSQMLDLSKTSSKKDLIKQFNANELSFDFMKAWKIFIDKFGSRGPAELDIASPRYRDNPESLLNQIYIMSGKDQENAIERYDRCQKERNQAYDILSELTNKQGWAKSKRFKILYHILETFGGYREHHKYFVIRANNLFRQRALQIGKKLVSTGKLENKDQVFDLTIDELEQSVKEPGIDLNSAIKRNTAFINQIKNRNDLPSVIDSRGRIFKAKRPPITEGDLSGQPLSTGIARGKVKVLATPDEKPLLPGEILVARATDPGWTPLFINAGAIVLEIGGLLQHGALVAREYGKPCVSGVLNATGAYKDGDYIEVDGTTGIIRELW